MTWLGELLCRMGRHKDLEVAYGYPAFSRTWLTIRCCKRRGRYKGEWDDLFADPRPKKWPLERDCMNYKDPRLKHMGPWRRP